MGEFLKKREDESLLGFYKRITDNRKEMDIDYAEWAKAISGKEYSSENGRKMFYCVKPMLDSLEEEKVNSIDDTDLLNEIELKKLELEKEKIKLQDQKREYRSLLRTDARFEHLVEEMKKSLSKINSEKPLINTYNKDFDFEESTEAVIILSDWHFGIREKNYWNEISIDILAERINKLKNYIIKYSKRHKVSTLHVEILGDMINGLIHIGTRISNEEDVLDQTMHCAELIAQFLNELASEIPYIKVYSATGNHGRCSANIKESLDTENFERLIPWYLKGRLENNITLVDNVFENDIIIYQFLNEVIFAVHGHNDKVKNAVNELSKMFKIFPTELHMGHYHSYYEFEDHDITTTVNGTASGVDKFAKKIRKTATAMQTMIIYNKNGRECTYKIKLNNK